MYYWLAITLLLLLALLKIIASLSEVVKCRRMRKLVEIATLDQIVKVIQCISITATACLKGHCSIIPLQSWTMFRVQTLESEKVRVLARDIRKIVKFIKAPRLIKSFSKQKLPTLQIYAFLSSSTLIQDLLKLTAAYLKILGQMCLIVFFLINHYQTFSELKIMEFQQQNVEQISRIRLTVRMWYSILLSLSILINLITNSIQLKVITKSTEMILKQAWNSLLDLVAHFCDIMFFYGLLHTQDMLRWKVGLYGAMAAGIRVYRALS